MQNQNTLGNIPDKTIIWLCYALYACSLVSGGITALVAVIINYILKNNNNHALIASHIQWQISTFWKLLIGSIALVIVTFILNITIIFAFLSYILWLVFIIWYIYRIAKGALALNKNSPV